MASRLSKLLLTSRGRLQLQGQHVLVLCSLKPSALRVFSTTQASLELLTLFPQSPKSLLGLQEFSTISNFS